MKRHDYHHCAAPTTMYAIIGDADGVLERDKFAIFALLSSLLVPHAAQIFGRLLRRERDRKRRHERFVKRYYLKRRRDFRSSERHLERLLEMIEERWFFPHQPRTVENISGCRPPFNPPNWVGDSADGLVAVPFSGSSILSAEEACRLVRDFGYDAQAAFSSVVRPIWMNKKPDRRRVGVVETDGNQSNFSDFYQPIPYVAAPTRQTKQGFLSRDSVLKAVAKMRTSNQMRFGVVEVVFRRQSPTRVAERYSLNLETLKKYATRIRQRVSGVKNSEKANENHVSEGDLSTLWH